MIKKNFLTLFLLLQIYSAANTEKLYPVDEAEKDASFIKFREELMLAVQKQDTKFILSVLDENIVNSFGGNDGVQGFKEHWRLASKDTELWKTLYSVLTMGGSFEMFENEKTFCAPYVYSKWLDAHDPFEHVAITGKNVKVREKPSPDAKAIGLLTYDVVKKEDRKWNNNTSDWVKVFMASGKTGYVSEKYTRSPIDYRACFKKVNGQWRMTVLVAGD